MLTIDERKSAGIFEKDVSKILDFLRAKGITSKSYLRFLSETCGGFADDNYILINGEEYSIEMFFGKSKEPIYDLIKCNELMEIDTSKFVAIGSFFGDDIIGMVPGDECVYYCALDDTNLKGLLKIGDTFDDLLHIIN